MELTTPDYTAQLERLIGVLSNKEPWPTWVAWPTWVVSIVSVVIGAIVAVLLALAKERYDAHRLKKRIKRSLYGEMLLNYTSLLGTTTLLGAKTAIDFQKVAAGQKPFDGIFSFDALENTKAHGDVLYGISHYGAMRTLYKMFAMISGVAGGGVTVEALALDGIKNFETLFVLNQLDQKLLIGMARTIAPNITARLSGLSLKTIKPGETI